MVAHPAMPGPRGHWLWGSLSEVRGDLLGFFARCKQEYGDAAYFRLGSRRSMLLSHPREIEQCLLTDNKKFVKNFGLTFFLRPLLGNGLLLSERDVWLRQRRLIQPAFSKRQVDSYAPAMTDLTARMLADWRDGDERDIAAEMMHLTMAIAGKTLLGVDVGGAYEEVAECLQAVLGDFLRRFGSPWPIPYWFPTPGNWRLKRTINRLDRIIQRLIEQRRSALPAGGFAEAGASDFLSLLIQARDENDGGGMTDLQLRDEVMTMFIAGHETTANALAWTWRLLGLHPEAQARLWAEVDQVLTGRTPTPADLPALPYCEQVLKESLRLYPPAYVIGRRATEDCHLGDHFIPRGHNVLMSQWIVQRDERWYHRPDDFLPERWTAEFQQSLPKYAYFPFGGGPRVCIGNGFAMLEATLILARIAQRFEMIALDPEPMPLLAGVTLRARQPMRVRLRARNF